MLPVEPIVALEQAETIGAFGQTLQSRSRSLASAEIAGNACAPGLRSREATSGATAGVPLSDLDALIARNS
jgi:hypothetical protein